MFRTHGRRLKTGLFELSLVPPRPAPNMWHSVES